MVKLKRFDRDVMDICISKCMLQDAPDNASLALCTATVMFVLSQDRLNMDLDRYFFFIKF